GPGGVRAGRQVLVVVNDFNGDGLPDLAIHFGSTVQVRLGQIDGSFKTAFQQARRGGLKPVSLAVGDFIGNGRPDLLMVSQPAEGQGSVVSLLLDNGNGTFTPAPRPVTPRATLAAASQKGN